MDDAKRELVHAWLIKADNDLTKAREIGAIPDGSARHGDLSLPAGCREGSEGLPGISRPSSGTFARRRKAGRVGGSLRTRFRPVGGRRNHADPLRDGLSLYPGESAALEPSRVEFDEALELAAGLVNFVLSLLPKDVQPNG